MTQVESFLDLQSNIYVCSIITVSVWWCSQLFGLEPGTGILRAKVVGNILKRKMSNIEKGPTTTGFEQTIQ